MKTILAAVLVMFSSLSFAGSFDVKDPLEMVGDRCAPGNVIYYGQNMKHTKEVLVCQLNTNIIYEFGKIGFEPDLVLKKDVTEVTLEISDGKAWSNEYLYFPNGKVIYQVGHTGDLIMNTEEETVRVINKKDPGNPIEIQLDPATVINGIRSNYAN